MPNKNYYTILGVEKTASGEEIKSAYREEAKKYHPDKTNGDPTLEQKFKDAAEAYDVLSDSNKRAQYDQRSNNNFPFNFTGSMSGTNVPLSGSDIRVVVNITFEESFSGVSKSVEFVREVHCNDCGQTGCKPDCKPIPCKACGGSGWSTVVHVNGWMRHTLSQPCSSCKAKGNVVAPTDQCPRCFGKARIKRTEKVDINVPQGVGSNDATILRGYGHSGTNGGPPGDAILVFRLLDHSLFTREGMNVVCVHDVPFTTMALGGKISVPSLKGNVDINLPSNSNSGKVLRLNGLGFTVKHLDKHGDMYVRLNMTVPSELTTYQKKILQNFAKLEKAKGENTNVREEDHRESGQSDQHTAEQFVSGGDKVPDGTN